MNPLYIFIPSIIIIVSILIFMFMKSSKSDVPEPDVPEPDVPVVDIDCEGEWSKCTKQCEKADQRVFTVTRAQSGNGSKCPEATDCLPGIDECPLDIDCEGKWSDCTAQCESGDERVYEIITEQSGKGSACDVTEVDCALETGCVKPQNCRGSWSECTEACERKEDRIFTEIQPKLGVGSDCPEPQDCKPGFGACPPNINCEGRWSSCDDNGRRTFETTQNQSGQGTPCPTNHPPCDGCSGYIEPCSEDCESARQRRFVITQGGYKNIDPSVTLDTKNIIQSAGGKMIDFSGPGSFPVDLTKGFDPEWTGVDCPRSISELEDWFSKQGFDETKINDCTNNMGDCECGPYRPLEIKGNRAVGKICALEPIPGQCMNSGYKTIQTGFVGCPGTPKSTDAINLFSQEQLTQIGVDNAWQISVIRDKNDMKKFKYIKEVSPGGPLYVANAGGEDIYLPERYRLTRSSNGVENITNIQDWTINYCGEKVPEQATQNLKDAMAAIGYNVGEIIECGSCNNICKTKCTELGSECSGFSINTKNGNCRYQINNAPSCVDIDDTIPDQIPGVDVCLQPGQVSESPLSSCAGNLELIDGDIGVGWKYLVKNQ